MVNLIVKVNGSMILDILTDNDICEEYKITNWDMDEDKGIFLIEFTDNDYRFNFICDYNLKEIEIGDPEYIPFQESYRFD